MTAALDDLAREGARRMILAALEAEVEEYLVRHRAARDERGHAVVVRNGQARPRRVTVGAGVNDLLKFPPVRSREIPPSS